MPSDAALGEADRPETPSSRLDEASEVVGDSEKEYEELENLELAVVGIEEVLGVGVTEAVDDVVEEEKVSTCLPKNRASCTSVESSSPGMISSLGFFILRVSLWTLLLSFWEREEGG